MLTSQEQAEFTAFNACAFYLSLRTAQAKGERIPCWLCMSDNAKEDARINFLTYMNEAYPSDAPFTEATIYHVISSAGIWKNVQRWKQVEIEKKRLRDAGPNPQAFFAS